MAHGSRLTAPSLGVLFAWSTMTSAHAHTIASCGAGDAPSPYASATCQSVCTVSGSDVVCETETVCTSSGANAFVVTSYGTSSHDMVAFGNCTGAEEVTFCCTIDETGAGIDTVELSGTPYDDEILSFSWSSTLTANLKSWDTDHLEGYIRGNAGNDMIYGSNWAGGDYHDNLYGQNDNDLIYGQAGADLLVGGLGNDGCSGGAGNDTLKGGDGDDDLLGDGGDDALCDLTGWVHCASQGGNFMNGGDGDDKLWYNEGENPNQACPDVLLSSQSTVGPSGDYDVCGDANDWSETELAPDCLDFIDEAPAQCEGSE